MKKNKAMRAAGALFVATMLSTSIVSGTYAKYVTTGTATDSARVAKFGVEIAAQGTLFSDTYVNVTGGNTPGTDKGTETITVSSRSAASTSGDNVVAPGTTNSAGLNFGVKGTPEVSVKVEIGIEAKKDIFLTSGFYTDVTVPAAASTDPAKTFALGADYHPIVWTLKQNNITVNNLENVSLSAINEYFEDLSLTFPAKTNLENAASLSGYTLSWMWDFDASGSGTYDKADTVLGDLAAGSTGVKKFTDTPTTASDTGRALIKGTDYNLDIDVTFTITVTQVD